VNELSRSGSLVRAIERVTGRFRLRGMAAVIELEKAEWSLIEPLFDPQGRQGAPATYSRREMVNAMLFIARTGL